MFGMRSSKENGGLAPSFHPRQMTGKVCGGEDFSSLSDERGEKLVAKRKGDDMFGMQV